MPRVIRRLQARHLLRLLPIAVICALATLVAPAAVLGDPSSSPESAPEATQSYIVVLEDSVNHPGRVAQRHAVNRHADLDNVYRDALEGYSAEMTPADKEAVEADPNVAYVELDVPMELLGQTIPTGVKRIGALDNADLKINETDEIQIDADIAVIDTGVDARHPDLNVARTVKCGELDGSSHTCADTDRSWGTHATHVAGVAAARDNGIGVVGVAPGARIWSAAMGSHNTPISDIVAGIDWAVGLNQIEVMNLSVGCFDVPSSEPEENNCSENSSALEAAISDAVDSGIVVVAAAGNYHQDVAYAPFIPASFADPITVSALADFDGKPGALAPVPATKECESIGATKPGEQDDSLAEYSNWGNGVDIAAPGSCIYSTVPLNSGPGGADYMKASGTSFAAPYVAGAAAILTATRKPSNRGDVMAIRQEILDAANFGWTDDSGYIDPIYNFAPDTVQEPLLDVHDKSVFSVPNPGPVGSIGVASHAEGSIDLFARNASNEIWHKVYHPYPYQWGTWYTEALPYNNSVPISGAPAVGSREPLSRDLFVKGDNGELYFRNFYDGTWSSWFWIQGPNSETIQSSPAVTDRPDRDNGLDVVVRAKNNLIYFKEYTDPTGWSGWQSLGGPSPGVASSPATAVHLGQYWHVMVRGADGNIWDRAWGEGLGWSSWVNLGSPSGGATSAPALTATESGNDLYLFVRGADEAIHMRKGTSGGWTGWESLGGKSVSDPAATSMSSAGVSVFISGLDNKVQERRYLYGGWTNWMRIDDNYCPPPECTWQPSLETFTASLPDPSEFVTVDSSGTANVFFGYDEGFDLGDPVESLEGELDSALLDGKGHYVVDVADVNDDDNSDLITVKDEGKVLVHLGTEERTFEAALDTGISLPPVMNSAGTYEPIAVADVTGDGFDDLVAVAGLSAGSAKVYKGQSNGKFETTAVTSLSGMANSALLSGAGSYILDVVDVDGDGLADLIAMNTAGTTYVCKGQSDGKFATPAAAASMNPILNDGNGAEPVGVADITGDGRADMLTHEGSTLKIWAGKSDGKFAASTTAYGSSVDSALLDGTGEELLGLLDYDADGRADLVALDADGDLLTYKAGAEAKFAAPVVSEGELTSVKGDELSGQEFLLERPFQKRVRCAADGCPWPRVPDNDADVDGDGRADLLTLHTNGRAYAYAGIASGFDLDSPGVSFAGWMDSALYDDSGEYMVDVADVDGDNRGDLVTQSEEGEVSVHPGKIDRTFASAVEAYSLDPGLEALEPIATADVTGDRLADLVQFGVDGEGQVLVAPGQADGTFSEADAEVSLQGVNSALGDGSGEYFLDAIDVTGDAHADLVSISTAGTLKLYKGQADGKFAAATTAASGVSPIMEDGSGHEPVGLGDVNGDGRADLLTLDAAGTPKLFAGKADGTFATPTTAIATTIDSSLMDGTGKDLAGLFDNNRDGRTDLVTIGKGGVVTVHRAESNGTFNYSGVAQGGSVLSNRFATVPGEELVAEKPMLRRTGCTPSGCDWPPAPAEEESEGEAESTEWSKVAAGEAEEGMTDVWCGSSWSCEAVGEAVTDSGAHRAQVFGWVGSEWSPSWPLAAESRWTALNGLSCLSSSACTGVGSYDNGSGPHALLLKKEGSSWKEVTVPEPAGAKSSTLSDVSCADSSNCMAVGRYVSSSGATWAMAVRWNGSAWSVTTTPTGSLAPTSYIASSSTLSDVSCPTTAMCSAVGSYVEYGTGKTKGLGLKWSSSAWSAAATPGMGGANERELAGVACISSSSCVAVGHYTAASGETRNWTVGGDGSSWSTTAASNPSTESELTAVTCAGSTCFASGSSTIKSKTHPTVLESVSGADWEDYVLDLPAGAGAAELAAIACSEGECNAVGTTSYADFGERNAAYGFYGGSGTLTDSGGSAGAMRAISCVSGTQCTGVSDGTGWQFDGEEWEAADSAAVSGQAFGNVSCTAANQCTAVGSKRASWPPAPLAERWNGTSWSEQTTPNPGGGGDLGLNGVSCYASNGCISVGWYWQSSRHLPLAQKWNGSSWSATTVPTPSGTPTFTMLRDVACTSSSDCFAVGSSSASSNYALIERWNGSSWSLQSAPLPGGAVGGSLRAVSCSSTSACTAVGTYTTNPGGKVNPLVLRWNGTSWAVQLSSPPSGALGTNLYDVSCYSASGCVAVGDYWDSSGYRPLAMRWNGSTWTLESTPLLAGKPHSYLESVSCPSAESCKAVGAAQFESGRSELLVLVPEG